MPPPSVLTWRQCVPPKLYQNSPWLTKFVPIWGSDVDNDKCFFEQNGWLVNQNLRQSREISFYPTYFCDDVGWTSLWCLVRAYTWQQSQRRTWQTKERPHVVLQSSWTYLGDCCDGSVLCCKRGGHQDRSASVGSPQLNCGVHGRRCYQSSWKIHEATLSNVRLIVKYLIKNMESENCSWF